MPESGGEQHPRNPKSAPREGTCPLRPPPQPGSALPPRPLAPAPRGAGARGAAERPGAARGAQPRRRLHRPPRRYPRPPAPTAGSALLGCGCGAREERDERTRKGADGEAASSGGRGGEGREGGGGRGRGRRCSAASTLPSSERGRRPAAAPGPPAQPRGRGLVLSLPSPRRGRTAGPEEDTQPKAVVLIALLFSFPSLRSLGFRCPPGEGNKPPWPPSAPGCTQAAGVRVSALPLGQPGRGGSGWRRSQGPPPGMPA